MKKIALIYFLFTLSFSVELFAFSISAESKIYSNVLHGLSVQKEIKIWTDDKSKEEQFAKIQNVICVEKKEDAEILLLFHTLNIKSSKLIFVGSYTLLKHYKQEVLGGFYWQKGRPNLLFLKENLEKHGLVLPQNLTDYIDSRL